ncbi:WSC-domain-containing protein [Corynespora cassiicola Philippines]|uniref:WSC-domain-containing protein n=1 Tax=Corynespora cassiicola Philippines TaxID=1448308 RepID=A0A2T2N7H1_CORCC|nr:WSC-domain-containing protein [Corynespora cassiicola Philippines]
MSRYILQTAVGAGILTSIALATQVNEAPCYYEFQKFTYESCYEDFRSARALDYSPGLNFSTTTVEKCWAACKSNGYHFAGLEYYGECFCGANIASDKANETDCNFPCNGNQSQVCGGFNRISVYSDPTFPDEVIADADDYESLGCWSEGDNGRALGFNLAEEVNGSALTTDMCLNACGAKGYPYAGTEYGQITIHKSKTQYYPRNLHIIHSEPMDSVQGSECSYPCNGDNKQSCGGQDRLNLYLAKALLSSQPCGYVPAPVSSWSIQSTLSLPSSRTVSPWSFSSINSPTSSSLPYSRVSSSSISSSASYSSFNGGGSVSSLPSPSSSWNSPTPSWSSTQSPSPTRTPFSTFSTKGSSISIPSNTYTAPPYTPTQSSKPPPAPTSSCVCATPAPWAGNKCVGKIPLPCVGCNDVQSQRPNYPYKLFNHKDTSRCKSYKKEEPQSACRDACTSQYQWCLGYADDCKKNRGKPGVEDWQSAKSKCAQQYNDCWKVNGNMRDQGHCKAQNKDPYVTDNWYGWLNGWLNKWGF